MLNLAVCVSGRGSNLRAIQDAIDSGSLDARVVLVLSSRDEAPALAWARERGISGTSLQGIAAEKTAAVMIEHIEAAGADFLALAGYMKRVPETVVRRFSGRIVNVHPALLPAFGGKGMYGQHVHQAVLASGARVSGATVHLVDEEYDRGPIVLQRVVPVEDEDTPETLAARVLAVEHRIFPDALQLFSEGRVLIRDGRAYITK